MSYILSPRFAVATSSAYNNIRPPVSYQSHLPRQYKISDIGPNLCLDRFDLFGTIVTISCYYVYYEQRFEFEELSIGLTDFLTPFLSHSDYF